MSHEGRSEALIELLAELEGSGIPFVLVGGYAISQFETRFSCSIENRRRRRDSMISTTL